jgi:hypothetical protein
VQQSLRKELADHGWRIPIRTPGVLHHTGGRRTCPTALGRAVRNLPAPGAWLTEITRLGELPNATRLPDLTAIICNDHSNRIAGSHRPSNWYKHRKRFVWTNSWECVSGISVHLKLVDTYLGVSYGLATARFHGNRSAILLMGWSAISSST